MAGGSANKRAGKGGSIVWSGSHLALKEYTADHKGDDLDTTSFEDSGKETGLIGIEVLDCSARGDWDATTNYMTDPPGIFPRSDGGPVKLYTNFADADFWNLPIVRVLSARNTNQVRGLVGFECSFKSNGTFTHL